VAAGAAGDVGLPCYLSTLEDRIFLLALHGAKEQWQRATAALQSCGRMLDLTLLLSRRLFAIPAATLLMDGGAARLADRVLERLASTAKAPPGPYVVPLCRRRSTERRGSPAACSQGTWSPSSVEPSRQG